jgi:protein-S-isoprenylcysteine O-methyltransferase Ste14
VHATGVVPQHLARPIAAGGLVLFVSALLYFAYRYSFVFGRETTGAISMRAIGTDVLLFSVFALHHSVFARDIFRNRITRMVGALERSVYVWVASALFVAICAWWQQVPGALWVIEQPAPRALLAGAQLLGVVLTIRSALMLDFLELGGFRQVGTDRAVTTDSEFKATGPYGWVRHPIYAGWFLMVFAVPGMTLTRLVFAATSSAYLLIAIPLEERSLRRSSSGAYDRYMREVPWKLVPRLF